MTGHEERGIVAGRSMSWCHIASWHLTSSRRWKRIWCGLKEAGGLAVMELVQVEEGGKKGHVACSGKVARG